MASVIEVKGIVGGLVSKAMTRDDVFIARWLHYVK